MVKKSYYLDLIEFGIEMTTLIDQRELFEYDEMIIQFSTLSLSDCFEHANMGIIDEMIYRCTELAESDYEHEITQFKQKLLNVLRNSKPITVNFLGVF